MKLRRVSITVLLLTLTLAVIGCSSVGSTGSFGSQTTGASSAGSGATANNVAEKGLAFSPATLEVKVGDTVTFKNEDSAPHDVKIDGRQLGVQDPGASVTWSAARVGSFPYVCAIHPAMTGEIVVK